MRHDLDQQKNTARYFVEHRQVSWAILAGVLAWGFFGYVNMPQRKDPEIPVRETLAIARWPGMPAERVEQLVAKKVEARMAQNATVTELRSVTKQGVAFVFAKIDERVDDTKSELDDLRLKLDTLQAELPQGVAPIELVKDFGDTATLMLSVASPPVDAADLDLRARDLSASVTNGRTAFVWPHARKLDGQSVARVTSRLAEWMSESGSIRETLPLRGPGFTGFTAVSSLPVESLRQELQRLSHERLQVPELHPDVWQPVVVREAKEIRSSLAAVAGPKYSYRQLDEFTERIEKRLKALELVARVNRSGVVGEQVQLLFSQEKWGAYRLQAADLSQLLGSRSVVLAGGNLDAGGRAVAVSPSVDIRSAGEIGDILIPSRDGGSSAYLRDLVDIERGYESPAQFLNYFQWRDAHGEWHRSRAITLDVQMRTGKQIAQFEEAVGRELARIRAELPADLIVDRTSDQPEQVRESINLFMRSLWEAIALVVLVSWIGFWEWRSALVMALAIPITLAMTFGMMHLLGVDLQQVSIASLIIALGLLVDDPVVAGDAIKRELAAGRSPLRASWQGPTKLARAILFATITNIVAYLPFLLMSGDNRRFLVTLPIVMTCALVASRLVSMTFIPLLGYYLLKGRPEPGLEERRKSGFGAFYYRSGTWAIANRWKVLALATAGLLVVGAFASRLKEQFFPFERQYLSFVEVWLPQNASISATAHVTERTEAILRREAETLGNERQDPKPVLHSISSWIGGGSPRYWLSSNPETQQPNYAHILIRTNRNADTEPLIARWQRAVNAEIAGATIDVRRLETSAPIGIPVQIRLWGDDIPALRAQAERLKKILLAVPHAARVRDDWGEDVLTADLQVDEARATLAGVTHRDVAMASSGGIEGQVVGSLRDSDREIPIVTRMRMDERARAADLANLYIYSSQSESRVPLSQVATVVYRLQPARIARYQQFRTITVAAFPQDGFLASEVLKSAMPGIEEFRRQLPAGFGLEIAGEYKEQNKGFKELALVMLASVLAIYFALVIQFKHAMKPLIVFTAIPFGFAGALIGLETMGAPFGFMAFLGIASLVGVIVSHIIVLFDFIEDRHEEGAPLEEALLDAGIQRLRPVLITVAATVIALIPLARNGGPLWEPLCYVQIGGLTISTVVTLVLVPVVYAIFVKDLKLVRWDSVGEASELRYHSTPRPRSSASV